jgi:hypothetical protein
MHAGDREIATQQCESFLAGLVAYLDQGGETFWVNPIQSEAAARHKPYQLRKAVKAGLAIPETLFSNDPDEIRSFLRAHGGVVAHKLLESATWVTDGGDDGQIFAAHTVPVREDQLPDDDVLRLCPGIFQPFLEKRFELRVACLGDFLVALRIDSQADDRAASDWRLGQLHVDMVPYDLPLEVQEGCRRLLRELGLPHASLDFVVDKSGSHIFLEANPQGQFLFLETRAGLPLLDMFSEFLLAGSRAFTWRDDHEVIRYEDWKEVWTATWPAEAAEHVLLKNPLGAPDSA